MIVSKCKSDQLPLFVGGVDMKFRTMAQTRNFVGDWCEVATAAASGARRMKTDCNADICPDLMFDDRTYFESKAIGKTGSAIVYAHRAENDQRFCDRGNRLFYWMWNHGTAAGEMRSIYELREGLSCTIKSLAIVEFQTLYAILKSHPLKVLNNKKKTPAGARLGYGSPTYKHGWNVRLKIINDALCETFTGARLNVYGRSVEVPVVRAAERSHFDFLLRGRMFE